MQYSSYSRRDFIRQASLGMGMAFVSMESMAMFASSAGESTASLPGSPASVLRKKLGIALVGLGGYAGGQLAPALQKTQHCYLAGIVTGTPQKAKDWKETYNLQDKNIYNYSTFDQVKDNPDIDIIYVVLPNSMHAEYVVRAARAGKHVICEKPMAITVEDCDRMIAACKEAGKMLSIGYRLHFEPHNLEMRRLREQREFGALKHVVAEDGMSDVEGWRLDKQLAGGGPLMDVGIYCVQGARYTTGLEPVAVTAKEGPKKDPVKFKSVEESLTWQMEFPGGITADCRTSYSEYMNRLRGEAEKGWFELEPAYGYSGIAGKTSNGPMNFPQVNQQALQMDDFAKAIMEGRPTPVPGEMGRQDVKILQAIYRSMETGKRVEI